MHTVRSKTTIILVILTACAVVFAALVGARYATASSAMAPSALQSAVAVQVFPVATISRATFSTTYVKIGDMATFDVLNVNSLVELTFNGRIYVTIFDSGSSGAYFELRVDDTPTTFGIARGCINSEGEVNTDIHTSITGIFTDLSPGTHIASMWISGSFDGGESAIVNPGGWDADHLVVKEYVPFGFTYLPLIQR